MKSKKNNKKFIIAAIAIVVVFSSMAIYIDHRDKTKYDNEVIHTTDDDDYPSSNDEQNKPTITNPHEDNILDNPVLQDPNPIKYINPNDINELIDNLLDDTEQVIKKKIKIDNPEDDSTPASNNRDDSNSDTSTDDSEPSHNGNDDDDTGRNGQTKSGITPEDPFQTPEDIIDDNINFSINSVSSANVSVNITLRNGSSSSSIGEIVKMSPNRQYTNLSANGSNIETYLIKENGSVTKYTNEKGYWTYTRNSSLSNNFASLFANGVTSDMTLSKSGNKYLVTQPLSSINNTVLINLSNTLGSNIKGFNGNIVYSFDSKGNLLSASISNAKSGNNILSATISYTKINKVKDSDINIPTETKSNAIDSEDTGNTSSKDSMNIQVNGSRLNLFSVISLPSNWTKDQSYSSNSLAVYFDEGNNPLYLYLKNSKVTGVSFSRNGAGGAPNISIRGLSINSTKDSMFNTFGEISPYSVFENDYETYKYSINADGHTYNLEIIVTLNDNKIAEMSLSAT